MGTLFDASVTRRGYFARGPGTLRHPDWCGGPTREVARGGTGRVTSINLVASPTQIDLAGATANTWSSGSVPPPVVRLGAGDTLRANVRNRLPVDSSVHWHGLALRNDIDGVPGSPPLNQAPTGSSRTSARSSTVACVARSSSMTPTNLWHTMTNGCSSSTTGSTG